MKWPLTLQQSPVRELQAVHYSLVVNFILIAKNSHVTNNDDDHNNNKVH